MAGGVHVLAGFADHLAHPPTAGYRGYVHLSYHLPVLLLATLVGCSSQKSAADMHFDALRTEISKIQADQDRLMERLDGLEARAERNEKGAPQGDRPALKVVVLEPEGDPAGEDQAPGEPEVDDAPRTVVRAHGAEDDRKGQKKAKGDRGASDLDADRELQDAVNLVKKKQYQRGIEALTAFLVRFPANPRVENAMFWSAEAQAGLGDSEKAIEQFEAVVARFPQGTKTPDALLRLALIQRKRGADDKARSLLARLRSDFPQSDAARRAPKE
jgi:tol-pal system protein YbgF